MVMQEFLEEVPLTGVGKHFVNLLRTHREANDQKKALLDQLADQLEFLMTHPSLEHTDDIKSNFNRALDAYAATMDDNTEAYMYQLYSLCQVVAIRCSEGEPYAHILESELSVLGLWNGESLFAEEVNLAELPAHIVESELRLRKLVLRLHTIKALANIGNMSIERNAIPKNEVEELIDSIFEEFMICRAFLSVDGTLRSIINDLQVIIKKTGDIEERARLLADSAKSTLIAANELLELVEGEPVRRCKEAGEYPAIVLPEA